MKNVWYVIVHRDGDEKRTRNLIYTCNYIKSLGFSVLVIEQDSEKRIEKLCETLDVSYQFIFNPGLFNRAWGFNCFKNFISSGKVFLADNDIILDKNILYDTVKTLDYYDVVRPFNGMVVDCDETETVEFIQDNTKLPTIKSEKIRNIFNFSGGVCSFRVDSFLEKIGGFDERFEGWGGEDDEMHKHLNNLNITKFSFNNIGIHLYHPRNNNEGNWQPNYQKNLVYINDNKRNENIIIGNIDKYV